MTEFGTEQVTIAASSLIRVFGLAALSFVLAMLWTPFLADLLYRFKIGKRIRQTAITGDKAPYFWKFHKEKANTPTMGGALVWVTTAVLTVLFNLSREGTWLPVFALVATGVVGAVDDLMNVYGIGPHSGGFRFRDKLVIYLLIAVVGAWWFAVKLDWINRALHIPGFGDFTLGWWYAALFALVVVGTAFAVDETDGLDGLSGGLLAIAFSAYAVIALIQNQLAIAAFCGTIVGALLAFLWFNIYPARFFMGDTGVIALGSTLAVIAFLTNQVAVLPIIGFVFVVEAGSAIVQIFSKRFLGRKVFLSAPIHHHFQAKGWPEPKIVMRFWVIGAVMSVVGIVVALFGRSNLPGPF
jgi:phospho-N-acetylmuramoyl-pentapeptide-transferase